MRGVIKQGKNSKIFGSTILNVDSWSDLSLIEPATEGQEVFVSLDISGTNSGRYLARRTSSKWIVPGADTKTINYVNQNQIPNIPPTTPKNVRILGRSTTFMGNTFDDGTNTSAWWAYGAAGIQGPTNISYTHRFKNQTGKTVSKLAIPFFSFHNNTATILAVWVGNGGSGYTASNWQQMTFSGSNSYQPLSGTSDFPSTVVTDTLTLNSSWLSNNELVVRVIYSSAGQIPAMDSFGTIQNNTSTLCEGWIGVGDAGSVSANLNNSITWYGNWQATYPHLFLEFADQQYSEVSILAYGDSVINNWKIYLDSDASIRDNWTYFLELENTNKKWHLTPAGNGGQDIPTFCNRLMSMLNMYLPWVDVFCLEGWTPNNCPATMNDTIILKNTLLGIYELITNNNKGWAVIFPSPTGGVTSGTLNFAALGEAATTYHNEMISWANLNFPGRILDLRSGVSDPNNTEHFLPAYSIDDIHQTRAGAEAFAAYAKPRIDDLLIRMGYEI